MFENQKTREGRGCFWGLFGGSPGKLRESLGSVAGKIFPNREMLCILRFWAPGKAHLPGSLGRHCLDLVPTFRAGYLLKSTGPAFSSFPENRSVTPQTCIVPVITNESHDANMFALEHTRTMKTTRFTDDPFVNYPFS